MSDSGDGELYGAFGLGIASPEGLKLNKRLSARLKRMTYDTARIQDQAASNLDEEVIKVPETINAGATSAGPPQAASFDEVGLVDMDERDDNDMLEMSIAELRRFLMMLERHTSEYVQVFFFVLVLARCAFH